MGQILTWPLFAGIAAWAIAQVMKTFSWRIKYGVWSFRAAKASGGFPSSHTATVISLAVSIGFQEKWNSPIFAIAGILAFIVMYDAINVRWFTGQNIQQTQALIKSLTDAKIIDKTNPVWEYEMKLTLGHKVYEVIGGMIVGAIVGTGFFWMSGGFA